MNKQKYLKFKSRSRKTRKNEDIQEEKNMRRIFEPDTYYPPHFRWNQWYKCCWLYRWRDIDLDIDVDVDAWEKEAKQLRRN